MTIYTAADQFIHGEAIVKIENNPNYDEFCDYVDSFVGYIVLNDENLKDWSRERTGYVKLCSLGSGCLFYERISEEYINTYRDKPIYVLSTFGDPETTSRKEFEEMLYDN